MKKQIQQCYHLMCMTLLLGFMLSTKSYAQSPILIKDIREGAFWSCDVCYTSDFTSGKAAVFVKMNDNKLFFFANDGQTGVEPYITDGTSAGTKLIKDIIVGKTGSITEGSEAVFNPNDNKVYFFASKTLGGKLQLFATDGTEAGTVQVNKTDYTENIKNLTFVGGGVFFKHGENRYYAAYSSDAAYLAVATTSYISNLGAFQGEIYTGSVNNNLPVFYKSDFKNGKAQVILSAFTDAVAGQAGRQPFAAHDGVLLSAETSFGIIKANIYYYNPTKNTCVKLLSDTKGAVLPEAIDVFKGKTYFVSYQDFYVTDGTAAGTTLLKNFDQPDIRILGHTDTHLFLANSFDNRLMSYNPTSGFTDIGNTIANNGTASIRQFLNLGNKAYIVADTPDYGSEFWETDGTKAGTKLLLDFYAGTKGTQPEKLNYMLWNGKEQIVFWATDKDKGREPYRMEVKRISPAEDIPLIDAKEVFQLLPNPAREEMRIVLKETEFFNAQEWSLTDMSGKKLRGGSILETTNVTTVALDGLQNGVYMVHLQNDKGQYLTQKIVVLK